MEEHEARLAGAWARTADGRDRFTQEGERFRVLFPGRKNGGPGPDFRGALLQVEGRRVRGDVEAHLVASGWHGHGHDSDPHFNQVVLHVVGRDDMGTPTRLANGARVPVLVLHGWHEEGHVRGPGSGASGLGPTVRPGGGDRAGGCLVRAGRDVAALLLKQGLIRFHARVARWRRARETDGALYRELLQGLGYGREGAPYLRLARALPWAALAGAQGLRKVQSRLLGTAGLMAAAPKDVGAELRAHWEGTPSLQTSSWRGPPCRPASNPARRLLGVGALFVRCSSLGLARSLFASLNPLPAPERAQAGLRRWLAVSADDAGLPPGPAPLGGAVADILAVNILLPFLASRPEMRTWAGAAYRDYPRLEPDSVLRSMVERLGLAGLRLGACGQQGLHRVFRSYCSQGRQPWCPLCQV